jgi:O-antigen biosynthesis protein
MTGCSIVIPVHNRSAITERCLDAIVASPADARSEIVVVDDASTDSTPSMLALHPADVRVVRHERNAGFAASCNDGVAAAAGEWIVLLNNDTIPEPGWLSTLIDYASAHERVGVVGAKLLFPDRTIQHAGIVFARALTAQHIYLGFPADHPAVERSREFQAVTGACMLIRRELFVGLGGFDPAFLNGYEDLDFCLRLRKSGYEVHYCHESVLYHLESATRGFDAKSLDSNSRNHELFLERWEGFVVHDDIGYYVDDGLIDIAYAGRFPPVVRVAPRLAVLHPDRRNEAERLLIERSRQVYEALKENTRLRVELLEATAPAANQALSSDGAPDRVR